MAQDLLDIPEGEEDQDLEEVDDILKSTAKDSLTKEKKSAFERRKTIQVVNNKATQDFFDLIGEVHMKDSVKKVNQDKFKH